MDKPTVTLTNKESSGKPRLSWEKVDGAERYVIYRAVGKKENFKAWKTTENRSVTDVKAVAGTTYYYKVRALCGEDEGKRSSAFSRVVSRACDLPQPVVKTGTRLSDAKPKLTWDEIKGASAYAIYRGTKKNGTYVRIYTTTKCEFTNVSAKAGKRYYYKVEAISKKTETANSALSEVKSQTCGQPYIVSSTDGKYVYEDFYKDMNKLVKKYPDILKKQYLGKTVDDRGLYALTFGNPEAEKQIFVTAGFHAREYINCQVTMRLVEYYCRNYESGSYDGVAYEKLFDQVSLCILPMVNPDGIAISAYGPSAIRDKKLRAKVKKIDRNGSYANWKANARGVDLNGNYINYAGPPDKTTFASEGYPGPKSYSERETKAVKKALEGCSNVKAVINYHSMGRVIYWGYHNEKYKAKCWAFVKLFRDITEYYTIDESDSPNARGDFEHYIMHEYKIPYVCIENGKGAVPISNREFESIYYKNRAGFAAAAHHYYK